MICLTDLMILNIENEMKNMIENGLDRELYSYVQKLIAKGHLIPVGFDFDFRVLINDPRILLELHLILPVM